MNPLNNNLPLAVRYYEPIPETRVQELDLFVRFIRNLESKQVEAVDRLLGIHVNHYYRIHLRVKCIRDLTVFQFQLVTYRSIREVIECWNVTLSHLWISFQMILTTQNGPLWFSTFFEKSSGISGSEISGWEVVWKWILVHFSFKILLSDVFLFISLKYKFCFTLSFIHSRDVDETDGTYLLLVMNWQQFWC